MSTHFTIALVRLVRLCSRGFSDHMGTSLATFLGQFRHVPVPVVVGYPLGVDMSSILMTGLLELGGWVMWLGMRGGAATAGSY